MRPNRSELTTSLRGAIPHIIRTLFTLKSAYRRNLKRRCATAAPWKSMKWPSYCRKRHRQFWSSWAHDTCYTPDTARWQAWSTAVNGTALSCYFVITCDTVVDGIAVTCSTAAKAEDTCYMLPSARSTQAWLREYMRPPVRDRKSGNHQKPAISLLYSAILL